jgi:hypothetical protein
MNNQKPKDDIEGTPNAGTRDSKGKHAKFRSAPA